MNDPSELIITNSNWDCKLRGMEGGKCGIFEFSCFWGLKNFYKEENKVASPSISSMSKTL